MDAIGRFEHNNHFNIWAGRFLPPSDRATFYGPYYANDWAPYAYGVAGFYPDVAQGRDNGVAYWGDFGMLKVQVGAFDGEPVSRCLEKGALTRPWRAIAFGTMPDNTNSAMWRAYVSGVSISLASQNSRSTS
jgi:hypothetical protein